MASREVPVYHICQHCGGDGCPLCSDLMILEGDIQLDPEWDDELPSVTSNVEFSSAERCASVASLNARMPFRSVHAEWLRDLEV